MAKKLLKESTIRRFQKLAKVAPINEMYSQGEEYLNEEDDDMDMGGDDMDMGDADMGDADMDMGGEEGTLELDEEEAKAIIALADKLEAQLGEDDMDMDDEAPEGDEPPEEDEDEEDMTADQVMEALRGISYVPSQGEVVNEVAKRVARRLKQAKLHEAKLNRALGKRR